jgi:hypothetical protein
MLLPLHPEGRETLDGRTTRLGVRYRVQAGGPATVEVNAHNPQGSVTIGPVVGFSTYLGGRGVDEGFGVTLDSTQHIVVAGDTNSSDFPTVRAMEGLSSGGAGQSDLFIAKLGADGRTLLYSTYIGGSGFDHAYDVAVDGAGNACVAGDTLSRDFPLANPVQATHAGGDDAVVVEISSAGDRLLFSSYLGGRGDDSAASLAVSPSGRVYVTGTTQSVDFPTVNALQSHSSRGDSDAFLSELDPATGKITYSTYLGGTGSDEATALALDATGNVYLTGLTTSVDFPTRRAVETYVAGLNTFVTKIDASGRSIVYSTYLGGPGTTIGFGIAVDSAGSA